MSKLSTVNSAGQATMSSQDISELIGSRHDSVKRTVERLIERGTIQLPPLVEVRNNLGQMVSEYKINKRDSYVVVAQLSPEFTAKLVDRWQELEGAPVQLNDHTVAAYLAEREKYVLMIEAEAARIRSTLFPLISEVNPSAIAIEQDLHSQRIEQVKEVIARRKERGATRITLTQLRDSVKNLKVFTGQKKLSTYLKNEVIPELVTGGQITVYDKLLYLN